MCKMMEIYIETLTGTAFELRVSPYETIQDVKARIQKLEGIPVSQQHLIWQSIDLEDDYSLQDYSIHDGATLKLVLTMRGGPINTRRIPVEDPTLREMAEYFNDANREEFMEKIPGNRPVTVIVYHNGDQLNFFRVVDRDSASPLSDSISGASMYNLYDEDDEEDANVDKTAVEENDKMKEKVLLLRSKMESLTLNKKPRKSKHMPRPPSHGRPSSKSKIRRFPSYSGKKSSSFIKNVLPPVAPKDQETSAQFESTSLKKDHSATNINLSAKDDSTLITQTVANGSHMPSNRKTSEVDSAKAKSLLTSVKEDSNGTETVIDSRTSPKAGGPSEGTEQLDTVLRRGQVNFSRSPRKWEFSQEVLLKDGNHVPMPPSSPRKKEPRTNQKTLERLLESQTCDSAGPGRPTTSSRHELSLEALKESLGRPPTSSRFNSADRKQGVILESMHPSEVRAMSGMLSNLVQSASRTRGGYTLSSTGLKEVGRIPTPEGRLVSARLQRLSASRDGRVMSPSHRLPPVKQKKKSAKRCFLCGKKTSLATSYQCRCGNNFCANHRYAESHECNFDYKTEGRKLLEQNNPVVTAPKLPKI